MLFATDLIHRIDLVSTTIVRDALGGIRRLDDQVKASNIACRVVPFSMRTRAPSGREPGSITRYAVYLPGEPRSEDGQPVAVHSTDRIRFQGRDLETLEIRNPHELGALLVIVCHDVGAS